MLDDRASAVMATSGLLCELLTNQPAYRRAWQQHVKRVRTHELSRAGVAQVIAQHLWDSGERADTDTKLPRRLRDRVRRALEGEKLTAETLTWFIRAFDMDETHEHQLWASLAGGGTGYQEGISNTLRYRPRMLRPMLHRTATIFERYTVNANRCVTTRHVLRVIAALEDGVNYCVHTHEPVMDQTEIITGGQLGPHYHDHDRGLTLYDIVLDKPLHKGCTASLEYRTSYINNYRPNEIRRHLPGRYENVDLAIKFDTTHHPKYVWFAAWPHPYENQPVHEELVSLDQIASAHRFIPFVEASVLGFHWQW